MIRCETCGNTYIKTKIESVVVTGVVELPGEKEVEAYKSVGIKLEPRLTRFELESTIDLRSVDTSQIDELTCVKCGATGNISSDKFRLVNRCRCGEVTDDIYPCYRLETIVCNSCRNRARCRRCSADCQFASNQEEEGPPVVEFIRPNPNVDRYWGAGPISWGNIPSSENESE